MWYPSMQVRGDFGYKDNVLLSPTDPQGSGFWMSGVEFMLYRLPSHGWQFSFFADATDVRYFDAPSVGSEQVALVFGQATKALGKAWQTSLGVNYCYQNQVYDTSTTYTNESSVSQVLAHSVTPAWQLRKNFGRNWIAGGMTATRQWLAEPLDSYWEFGPGLEAGYGWGTNSDLCLSAAWSYLTYDNREQVDALGAPIPGTQLDLNSLTLQLALNHYWDEKRRWRTTTSLGYEQAVDNGSGFYDFGGYLASQHIAYRDSHWDIRVYARYHAYNYPIQQVSPTDPEKRSKQMISAGLKIQRKLTKYLSAKLGYEWDRSISNLDFDDYRANSFFGGLAVDL